MENVYQHKARLIDGTETTLENWRGNVLLIVNVASKCGFTPQYEGLEKLFQEFRSQQFSILAFPCNQFMQQEPGNSDEIATFCSTTYDVHFPLFQKINVNGPNAHPLFVQLKTQAPGALGSRSIKWNFTKFLINRSGVPVRRFAPATSPSKIHAQVKALI